LTTGGGNALINIHQNITSIKDKNLINEVYLNMNKKMFKFALKKLKSDSDAEDALEETFFKITKYINKISELDCGIREAYCFKILENEIINILREREKGSPIELEKINCLTSYKDEYSFEDSETEDIEKLKIYINELSDDERFLMDLRFNQEMKFKDISKLLDVTEEVVKKRSQRAIKKLKSYFKIGDESAKS
jgi:RNA polymerase sigma-70 factor (ECF subfamily)